MGLHNIDYEKLAIRNWWYEKSKEEQEELVKKYEKQVFALDDIIFDQIILIYNSEKKEKQIKTFNSDLFKAYINKFSEEDRKKALRILEIRVSIDNSKEL